MNLVFRSSVLTALGFSFVSAFAVLTTACSGSSNSGEQNPKGDGGTVIAAQNGADSGVTTQEPQNTAGACKLSTECSSWACDCKSGPPVNSQSCTNGVCQTAAQQCPKSCSDFGSTWVGTFSGPYAPTTTTTPPTTTSPPAASCGTLGAPVTSTCEACLSTSCCEAKSACVANTDCTGLLGCLAACGGDLASEACQSCFETYPTGQAGLQALCAGTTCKDACN